MIVLIKKRTIYGDSKLTLLFFVSFTSAFLNTFTTVVWFCFMRERQKLSMLWGSLHIVGGRGEKEEMRRWFLKRKGEAFVYLWCCFVFHQQFSILNNFVWFFLNLTERKIFQDSSFRNYLDTEQMIIFKAFYILWFRLFI